MSDKLKKAGKDSNVQAQRQPRKRPSERKETVQSTQNISRKTGRLFAGAPLLGDVSILTFKNGIEICGADNFGNTWIPKDMLQNILPVLTSQYIE